MPKPLDMRIKNDYNLQFDNRYRTVSELLRAVCFITAIDETDFFMIIFAISSFALFSCFICDQCSFSFVFEEKVSLGDGDWPEPNLNSNNIFYYLKYFL